MTKEPIRLPAYTRLAGEFDSPATMVAALKNAAVPQPKPRPVALPKPRPEPTPRFVERYFRTVVNGDVSIITLTQLRQRSQGKPNTLLYWAESCWIGERYDSRFVDVVRISEEDAKHAA